MNLVNELIKNLLPEEEKQKSVGVYAGGFKPPTKGHFQVLQEAIDQNPEMDEVIVYIGKGERDGISQEISLKIWEIYGKYLPFKVKYIEATKPPIQLVYNYAKENPNTEVLWIIGAREENEDDFKDIASRTSGMSKYPNLELRTIITTGGISGTSARNAAKISPEKLNNFLPDFLNDKEKTDIFVMLNNIVTEAIVGGKIECDNCDWSWDIKDGGDDLFICHKCGHDNTPFLNENSTLELNISKFNYQKTLTENLWYTLNEISLSKDNAVEISGDLTGGSFKVGNITYTYSIKNIPNPYKDLGLFYNIQFTPEENTTSIPQGGKENYIKILSTMYKVIVDFIEKQKPEYVGIASLDNDGSKNYHKIYANLTNTKTNNIPGYFRKDVSLGFDTPQGKGRFIVLKRKKNLNENASYSKDIDVKEKILELTKHMLTKGMNIKPLPKVKFVNGNRDNAREFLGKTAYYNPNNQTITLYTEGRHPKDIVRSFAHEMVHHIQNLEGRLGAITTTNTQEDDNLNNIEAEANLKGTMTFRNWTDSLNEEILFEEEDQLMSEVVNPDGERFEYVESNVKGFFTYKDSYNNLYFARIFFTPLSSNPYFEFKTGWFKDNNLSDPTYDPHLPPNTTGMDNLKRRNTIAKIYRDEILPFFTKNKGLSNKLYIKPISHSRHIFSKRLVKNHTSKNFNIKEDGETIIISLPQNENNNKDPFGINTYAMELGRLREEKNEYQIYCDLDGVLADFERGYEELTGIDLQGEFKPEGEEFWDPIKKAGVGFWAGLKWMSDGKQLWDYINQYKPKLLSAPSRDQSSRIGKAVWVKHKIPGTQLILKYATQKKELATPTSILIDDRAKNIEEWEEAGGVGILHINTFDTIKQLQKLKL